MISIIIAVVSLLLVPFCMFYCKRCAILAIDNVGPNSSRTRHTGRSANADRTGHGDSNGFGVYGNDENLTEDDKKERKKRVMNVLKRVVIKVSLGVF